MTLTFKDFLLEFKQTPEEVAELLLEKCMPYINIVGELEEDTILYRGVNSDYEDMVARSRGEYKGITTRYSGERANILKQYFNDKCKIDLEKIMFTTGDLELARRFGKPYIIFPIGEFKYAYSPKGAVLPDISTIEDLRNANYKCGVADDFNDGGMSDPDFVDAIRSGVEILIETQNYFPMSIAFWNENKQRILEEISFR